MNRYEPNQPYEPYVPYSVSAASSDNTPHTPNAPQSERARHGRGVGLLCACLAVSLISGFGGGYLAMSLQDRGAISDQNQVTPASSPASTPTAAPSGAMTVSQVVEAVSNSVVEITTEVQQTNFFQQSMTAEAAGSGVVISKDGFIITNNHVVEGGQKITVRLSDGESYPAQLVGTDAQTDLAVLKIEAEGLTPAVIGSSEALQVGDEAIAIGNPLGELGGTVTNGIISAVGRDVTIGGETMNLLQTNAAINPGNSGGGLFNNRGELIGVVVAKSAGMGVEGLGFAIPVDTAQSVAEDIIEYGYVTGRGQLGVSVIDVSDQQSAFLYRVPQPGVYIAKVEEDSSAARAGLLIGDGILSIDGEEIETVTDLRSQLHNRSAGEQVEMVILREGKQQTVTVTLQEEIPAAVKEKAIAA